MIDLGPSAQRTADLVTSVTDEQLGLATPCPGLRVGDLIDHIGTFAIAFVAVATKDPGARTAPPPPAHGANLQAGWRERIAEDVQGLVEAWRDPQAWEGATTAGGVDLLGEVAGLVAIDELVTHGWDLAVATGQPYAPEAQEVEAALGFVSHFDAPRDGRLFGPIVPVDASAGPLDQLLGLTGRDPAWRPSA